MYVAFLRGINVGGNSIIKMAELKKSFESLGFKKVVPVLASGNIIFEPVETEPAVLRQRIEGMLTRKFKVKAIAILRTGGRIQDLVKSDPFKNSQVTPQTKLTVTFLAEERVHDGKFPNQLLNQGFHLVQVSSGEVCCAFEASPNRRTPDLMKLLEKEFGKNITTRTWTSIQKIAKVLET